MKVLKQWHDPQYAPPVTGQRVLIWLVKGVAWPGLGDMESGLVHALSATFFESVAQYRAMFIAPLVAAKHLEPGDWDLKEGVDYDGPFFLYGDTLIAVAGVQAWFPMPQGPESHAPEGWTQCKCGGFLRPDGKDRFTLACSDCHRKVKVSVEIVKEGTT